MFYKVIIGTLIMVVKNELDDIVSPRDILYPVSNKKKAMIIFCRPFVSRIPAHIKGFRATIPLRRRLFASIEINRYRCLRDDFNSFVGTFNFARKRKKSFGIDTEII